MRNGQLQLVGYPIANNGVGANTTEIASNLPSLPNYPTGVIGVALTANAAQATGHLQITVYSADGTIAYTRCYVPPSGGHLAWPNNCHPLNGWNGTTQNPNPQWCVVFPPPGSPNPAGPCPSYPLGSPTGPMLKGPSAVK